MRNNMVINPKEITVAQMHAFLLGAVSPRPIAFVSTVDKEGRVNLSPFSFFNVFSANPPILVFSPARKGRDNTVKDTYLNVLEVPEAVVNIISYPMVHQASLASAEYPRGINEFEKAGFTAIPSDKVKPPRVAESPVSMECRVNQVIELGSEGGAGNLVICEVLLMHIKDDVLDAEGKIDPRKLDAVARMGGDWYCRANGEALFRLPQPGNRLGLGFDQLPEAIKHSRVLTGSDLAQLAGITALPEHLQNKTFSKENERHQKAKEWLAKGEVIKAWESLV
ncbi:MAG: flavin reductase family protein, partial [Cyclobacteriaceae bacterium]|nr:flavin reductase family protein [Cyclobacteriaceae bacterium]